MILTALNIATACVAVWLMALVLRGTIFHVLARTRDGMLKPVNAWDAGDWMRLGVGFYHLKSLVRIVRWDIYGPLMRLAEDPDYTRTAAVVAWNTSFSTFAIVGSLCVLWALYRNIPEDERWRWNMLTAPWWPGKPPFFFGKL